MKVIRVFKDGSAMVFDDTSPDHATIKTLDGKDNPYTEVPVTEENMKKYFGELPESEVNVV